MRSKLGLVVLGVVLGTTVIVTAQTTAPRRGKAAAAQDPAARRAARQAAATAAVAATQALPTAYNVTPLPANIAPTVLSTTKVQVTGEPRVTKGHPCTLWDNQDIAHYKDMLKSSKVMQEEFEKLKADMDKRIAEPLGVPEPKKSPDGKWIFPGEPKVIHNMHQANAKTISDLGTMYVLTGDEKYGEFCRKMLLAYADYYPKYGHPDFRGEPWTERALRSANDGRLTGQFLADGLWLIPMARGYDLVYNLPSWTEDQRKQIREELFENAVKPLVHDILGERSYLDATHNRSAICAAGVLMAGYACDSQKLINYGLYGKNGTKEKPTGGVFGVHFTSESISPDGLWNEGSMGYHGMALAALIDDAEVLWHHGIDMYRHNNGILKGMFDSPIRFTYPDLTFPATHDSHRGSFVNSPDWATDDPHSYEYGYRRYGDPRYLAPVTRNKLTLRMSIHHGPPSVLFDQDLQNKPSVTNTESVNFFDVGFGILRLKAPVSPVQVLLEYGPSRSHSHADKLTVDVYALGDVVMPDPGIVFPYNYPLDATWYRTTQGHATLAVDEKEQIYFGNRYMFRTFAEPDAPQIVFAPGETLGMQRAGSNTVYPGVQQDRAIFVTPEYMADIFGAFSNTQHKYDLSWHLRGKLTTDLPLQDLKFPDPVANGYSALKNVRKAATDKPWSVTVTQKDRPVRLVTATSIASDVIVGDGFNRAEKTDEIVPAIYERRTATDTVFGSVLDVSGAKGGFVRSVSQEGSLETGGAVLKVTTARGTDLCVVSWREGPLNIAGVQAQAQQAMVAMDADGVRAMALAGRSLKIAGGSIERSEPGLAVIERLASGAYLVSNPAGKPATITITLPALKGLSAVTLDAAGKAAGPAKVATKGEALSIELPAQGKVRFEK